MKKATLSLLLSLGLAAPVLSQVTVETDPVGFVSVTVPANSDITVGAPLARASEFQGRIEAITGNVITVAGTPNWQVDQFKFVAPSQPKTFLARIDSGVKEGMHATITANTSGSLSVTMGFGDDLTGIVTNFDSPGNGDYISIVPAWTPASLFSSVPNGTNLLLFRPSSGGVNNASTQVFTFAQASSSWLSGFTNVNHNPILPGEGVVLRNNSASPSTISMVGAVPMSSHRVVIRTLGAGTPQDQRVVFQGPVPQKVGTVISGFENGDQLLFFNNSATGQNKASSVILTWSNTAWLQGFTNVSNSFDVSPGQSFIYRKKATASPQTFVWQQLQAYLQ